METDICVELLRLAYQRDIAQATEYVTGAGHFSALEARRLAYDPAAETSEQQAHLRTCGRCLRLLSHLRAAIDHPAARLLAEFAECTEPAKRTSEVRLHLKVDSCRACLVRLDSSLTVAAHRALIRAGHRPAAAVPARPVLSAFVRVPVGLRSSDSSSTIEAQAIDRERSVTARLWQVEKGELEVVVRADDSSLAHARLPVELAGSAGSWEGDVVLDERDDYGWIGRRPIGSSRAILTELLGSSGEGLALTVSLPAAGEAAGATAAASGLAIEPDAAMRKRLATVVARLEDSHESLGVRVSAVQFIASAGPAALTPEVLSALRRVLDEAGSPVRAAAIRTLEALAG